MSKKRYIFYVLFGIVIVYIAFFAPLVVSGSEWNRIVVGQSTPKDVIRELGPPDRVTINLRGRVYTYLDPVLGVQPLTIVQFHRQRVVQIQRFTVQEAYSLDTTDYGEKYGNPERVLVTEFEAWRTLIYVDDGLIVVAKATETETLHVISENYVRANCNLICAFTKVPNWVHPRYLIDNSYTDEWRDPWEFTH